VPALVCVSVFVCVSFYVMCAIIGTVTGPPLRQGPFVGCTGEGVSMWVLVKVSVYTRVCACISLCV